MYNFINFSSNYTKPGAFELPDSALYQKKGKEQKDRAVQPGVEPGTRAKNVARS